MPHLVFEHTANMTPQPDWQTLLTECHQYLASTGEWTLADIKSRVFQAAFFLQGAGLQDESSDKAHITLTLQMLEGRSDSLKQSTAKKLGQIIQHHVDGACEHSSTNVTVQCVDIHKASYFKRA